MLAKGELRCGIARYVVRPLQCIEVDVSLSAAVGRDRGHPRIRRKGAGYLSLVSSERNGCNLVPLGLRRTARPGAIAESARVPA
jgi:hypothetical protein